jgi:pseudouridine synthase
MEMRLQKFLAQAGVASRRHAEAMMLEGRIRVNGQAALQLGQRIDTERDFIKVDGKTVRAEKPVAVLLHKPKGFMCTADDPEGRPLVTDLIRGVRGRLFPVGRLDFDTSGALLLTNDGDLAQHLIHPRHGVPRTYIAKVKGQPTPEQVEKLRHGVYVEGHKTMPARVNVAGTMEKNSLLKIVLGEGRNRQVKKMCEAIGHPVLKLTRVAFGFLTVGDLPVGRWRFVTPEELEGLRAMAAKAEHQAEVERAERGTDAPRKVERRPKPAGVRAKPRPRPGTGRPGTRTPHRPRRGGRP